MSVRIGSARKVGLLSVAVAALFFAPLLVEAASSDRGAPPAALEGEYIDGEILVGLAQGASSSRLEGARQSLGATTIQEFRQLGVVHWRLPSGQSVEHAMKALSNEPYVLWAEPNYIVRAADLPNDPLRNDLYGLHNLGQTGGTNDADIDALEAWDIRSGSPDVVVGVIDTGVDYLHEDLAGNIWTNPGEDLNGNGVTDPADFNGLDDDGNGFVDDLRGWDFVNNDNNPMDDNNHGTHVSGTIGAMGNNGVGVVGVTRSVKIMPLKFLSAGGSGSNADAILAINYAASFTDGAGNKVVRITSNSWGGGQKSAALENAIANSGALFVAAAGNSGSKLKMYPAGYASANIISVAATDANDALASFSNFGSDWVDLGAPGVGILSSIRGNRYSSFSGTSMATPHVAGVAALVIAQSPAKTNAQVKADILNAVDSLASLAGKTLTGGRLNALRALGGIPVNNDFTAPAAVSDLAVDNASTTANAVRLTWTATGDDGAVGTAYLYDIRYLADSAVSDTNWASAKPATGEPIPAVSGSTQSMTVTRLSPETKYYFAMKVVDEANNPSGLSNVPSETTAAPPAGTWSIQVVDDAGSVGSWSSLALNSSGNPHISYSDATNGDLKYATKAGGSWSVETVPDPEAYVGRYTSIALDSSGRPHIAYARDQSLVSWLKYAKWNGSAWSTETVDSQAQGVGWYASLALDSSDRAHISHYKQWGQNAAKYAKWTGSQWSKDVVEQGNGVGTWTSIALDANNSARVAYYGGDGYIHYAKATATGWSVETVGAGSGHTSLALDSSGNPHISYRNGNGYLAYAKWSGSAWSLQVVDSGSSAYTSLELDSIGNPHISYQNSTGGDLRYARWDGSSWSIETIDTDGSVGGYTSLELDGSGNPHISYYDATNVDLKYARKV